MINMMYPIGYNVKVFLATKANILDCLENYRGDVSKEIDETIAIQQNDQADAQTVTEEEFSENSPIAQTVNLLGRTRQEAAFP